MNKCDLQKIIEKDAGNIASIGAIARALGMDRHTIAQWLVGVPCLPCGRSKRFLAADVAERVIELKRTYGEAR